MNKYGTFYGIGVGPGDPELLTLKAKRVLEGVSHVFTPVAEKGKESVAYGIARTCISKNAAVEKLVFPMTTDRNVCEKAWEENATKIAAIVKKGTDAAFITIGDPMTYSTYCYLLKKMRVMYPEVQPVTIPGVTSYAAVAASANLPLAENNEMLALVPGNIPKEKIEQILSLVDTAVFLKHHRKTKDLLDILNKTGLGDKAIYVSRCGFEDQMVTANPTRELLEKTDYLSLLVVKKS